MVVRFLLAGCLLLVVPPLFPQFPSRPVIRSVQVEGNVRVPAATIFHNVSAAAGQAYDEGAAGADLHRLHALGLFQSLSIRAREVADGRIDLIYRVSEQPLVSNVVIEGVESGQEEKIRRLLQKEKLVMQTGGLFRPAQAGKAAQVVHGYLCEQRYLLSEVRIITEPLGGSAIRVRLRIDAGPRLDIGEVRFSGNRFFRSGELRKQLQHTRASTFSAPWMVRGAYVYENVLADLENLRRYYQSHGFAAVRIGHPEIFARKSLRPRWLPVISGSEQTLAVLIPVAEGPRFQLVSISSEGNAKSAGPDVAQILASVRVPASYDFSILDTVRQKVVEALGHSGYALANVQLEQRLDDSCRTARAVIRIDAGDPVAIGRIDFEGNTRLREKFLRRELAVEEGEVFDSAKLDRSIKRLNRSGMIQEVKRGDVALEMNQGTGLLDVTFKIKEKERQGIFGTGATGGIGGGYLGILYSAFDLLGLGESLTLELDGGASQSSALLNIAGSRFLGLPFPIGLSAFHRVTHLNVASLVPGTDDLVRVLCHRSTGAGLSGTYPVTSKLQAGLAARFERLSVSENAADDGTGSRSSVQGRTELAPSFLFDATRGTGLETRGTRLTFANSWSGSTLLRSIDAAACSFRLSNYLRDPLTHGSNSFAFRLQGAVTRPRNHEPLTLDRRFYPGDEIVRGFWRGALTPWAGLRENPSSLRPAGADTVLGFSAEYRIPIQGALSGAAFFDLGWSRLSKSTASLDKNLSLIEATSGLLRASAGGELRLQLPVIHKPGRLIFSWNPLRLDKWVQNASSPIRLADPRRTIRFALGDLF